MSRRTRKKSNANTKGAGIAYGLSYDEEDLEGQLRSILESNAVNHDIDENSKESFPSLLEEAEQIMDNIIKEAEREMAEIEQMIFPKRQEMESTITKALQEQLQAIDDHRNHSIQTIAQTLNGFKDIRDKLQDVLQEIDIDLASFKGPIDQELMREMEAVRNQEAEILRKELQDAEAEESRTSSEYTASSKKPRLSTVSAKGGS